jgi:hypothetical protein
LHGDPNEYGEEEEDDGGEAEGSLDASLSLEEGGEGDYGEEEEGDEEQYRREEEELIMGGHSNQN